VSQLIGPPGVTHKVPWPLQRVGLRKDVDCLAQITPPRAEITRIQLLSDFRGFRRSFPSYRAGSNVR